MLTFKNLFRRDASNKRSPLKADIQLQNHAIVVHPGESDSGMVSDDTGMISGVVTLKSDSSINVRSTRIAFVLQYRYKRIGVEQWEEGILHEQGETFVCGVDPDAIHVTYSQDGGLIQRRIDFAILVPKDIATYERLPYGKISPQIRVSVELDYADWNADELRALPVAPPMYVDDGTIVHNDHHLVTEIWSGGPTIPKDVSSVSEPIITSGSLSPGSTSAHQVQTWVKNFLINANPNPTSGPSTLRIHKRGIAQGIGEWNAYLWSDSFTVGSYVLPRIDFSHMAPECVIYTVELHLAQTCSVVPIEEYKIGVYDPEEYQYPTEDFLLHTNGERPATNKPGSELPALWRGRASQPKKGQAADDVTEEVERYTWEADKVRLPVAAYIRPSTCSGTKSPIHLKHKFVLKVYFSVTGQTVGGEPIPDANGVGHLRLLIVNLPQHLPSCFCVEGWVELPGYDESNARQGRLNVPLCACCYATEQFPSSTFAKAFPEEETEERERLAPLPTQCKSPVNHNGGGLAL